ncbi:hypothetical protein G9F72_010640 [Clostridium estertheticum]|uniref:hypothetical protein n=1 Tax=Clostridium estertheticum TaxID=238834 RepID=UPI0013E98470|nr:hypothetical protein [Clostridium estertheticum]MBZ9686782.1 hypothetical protein [Clostridium estertheticum]
MARIVADVLYNLEILRSRKLVETDRSGLVAGYVGQTALITKTKIDEALGLFIDEAYALASRGIYQKIYNTIANGSIVYGKLERLTKQGDING